MKIFKKKKKIKSEWTIHSEIFHSKNKDRLIFIVYALSSKGNPSIYLMQDELNKEVDKLTDEKLNEGYFVGFANIFWGWQNNIPVRYQEQSRKPFGFCVMYKGE